jgi:2-oxoisovalerate dehydrogenase E2 component (dihydrolipoyl transacylase)
VGRYVFRLPDLGEGAAEAEITAWHAAVGDAIAIDDPLVDVMTDKATMEIPSPVAGKILALHGTPGEKRPVGSDLAEFEVEGEGNAAAGPSPASVLRPEAPSPAMQERVAADVSSRTGEGASDRMAPAYATRSPGDKPTASPAVRRRAWELGIALQFVPGSGQGGRITHADLDAYIAAKGRVAAPSFARRDGVEEIKLIGLRRVIAERMQEAARHIPHFSYVEEVDVTALEELRRHLNQARAEHLTLLPFLLRALVKAMPEFPQINARFDDEAGVVRRLAAVHVGIATQTRHGLMVPVVFHAEALDLTPLAAEIARLATAARDGTARREELSGSTITITSLGALGGIASTPVINYPEVAIVGVNKIVERPMVRDGQIAIRKMMNLSSSFDHRVIDGWDAASFIRRVAGLLEQPATLFIEGA